MEKLYIDRNYLLDTSGNYLKILGNQHNKNCIISYVKFYPSKYFNRYINNRPYGYNTFVHKSFAILLHDPHRITYSKHHGGVVTCTPLNNIVKVFDSRTKLTQIWEERDKYSKNHVGKELIDFLSIIKDEVDISYIGITASFLIDAYNEESDIDLVCYGQKGYEMMKPIFTKYITPYSGENGIKLYNRRMMHMSYTEYETLMKQESRKLQGLTKKRNIHINCQPLWQDGIDPFHEIKLFPIGEISCILKIQDDTKSMFSPTIYGVKVQTIIEAELNGVVEGFDRQIDSLISFVGAYSSTFKEGESVYVEGMLVLMERKDKKPSYAIELSPWNTSRKYKAVLLSGGNL